MSHSTDAEGKMPWVKPRYLWIDVDRHGKERRYVAKRGEKKIRIYEDPLSSDPREVAAFWSAYALALDGKSSAPAPAPVPDLAVAGTFRWLVERWKESAEFRALGDETRRMRGNLLDAACLEPVRPGGKDTMGSVPLRLFSASHVRTLRDRKRETPEGANNRLKAIGVVFKWALDQDELAKEHGLLSNPARDVSKFKSKNPDGHHTWTVEEVERFLAHHPVGSRARLALALFLFTGQRRSDVTRFGPQHIREVRDPKTGRSSKKLFFTQQKNRNRKPVTLELPVLDVLQAEIDSFRVNNPSARGGHLAFLVTQNGKPFSVKGFGHRMRKWCDAAGLPNCSAHGLRKAGACIAAENGATDAQMMAIFGWTDPRMAAKYRRRANQKLLASEHMHLVIHKSLAQSTAPTPLLDWVGDAAATRKP